MIVELDTDSVLQTSLDPSSYCQPLQNRMIDGFTFQKDGKMLWSGAICGTPQKAYVARVSLSNQEELSHPARLCMFCPS